MRTRFFRAWWVKSWGWQWGFRYSGELYYGFESLSEAINACTDIHRAMSAASSGDGL